MTHIRTGPREEIIHIVPRDGKSAFFQEICAPLEQLILLLSGELRDIAGCTDSLEEAVPLVDFSL